MKLSAILAVLVSIVFLVVMASKAGKALNDTAKSFADAQTKLLNANI